MFPVSLILAPTTPFKTLKPQPYNGAPIERTTPTPVSTASAGPSVTCRDVAQLQRYLASLQEALNVLVIH